MSSISTLDTVVNRLKVMKSAYTKTHGEFSGKGFNSMISIMEQIQQNNLLSDVQKKVAIITLFEYVEDQLK